jgi:hypothetical protein
MGCYFQPMARMSGIDVAYCSQSGLLHGAHYGNSHFGPHVLSAKNVSYIHTWELYMGDFFPCSPMCASFYMDRGLLPFAYIFTFGFRFLSKFTF